jgi:hypothetical protein
MIIQVAVRPLKAIPGRIIEALVPCQAPFPRLRIWRRRGLPVLRLRQAMQRRIIGQAGHPTS